jgi:peptidoglycan L-alanyl-D-glutamate endopeptidase CwlK
MPMFSQSSLSNLAECHGDLQIIAAHAIKYFDFKIIEGHRGQAKQDAAFNSGNSKIKWPHGKHNKIPSLAFDAVPYPTDYKRLNEWYYMAGVMMTVAKMLKQTGQITHDIRWGGDWDGDGTFTDNKFNDLGHFEIV